MSSHVNTSTMFRIAGLTTCEPSVAVGRLIYSGVLEDHRPRFMRGPGNHHEWTNLDAVVCTVIARMPGYNVITGGESAWPVDLTRRFMARTIRGYPTAPFLVGHRERWLPAATELGAVRLWRSEFDCHAWIVNLAMLTAHVAAQAAA